MEKRLIHVFFVLALAFFFAGNADALTFNPFKGAGRVKATNLIIAGNYVNSRLLAELAQYYSKQPILLVSPDVDGGCQIFYMPNGTKASPMSADEFMGAVTHVNPKRVIVLGGDDYVPRKFVDLVRAKFSVVILDSNDWSKNADSLGELLKIKKLQRQYIDYKKNIDKIEQ